MRKLLVDESRTAPLSARAAAATLCSSGSSMFVPGQLNQRDVDRLAGACKRGDEAAAR